MFWSFIPRYLDLAISVKPSIIHRHVCFMFVIILLWMCEALGDGGIDISNGEEVITTRTMNDVRHLQAESITEVTGCPANHSLPCVPKCCDLGQSYSEANRSRCVDGPDDFRPQFKDCQNYSNGLDSIPTDYRYQYFIGEPCVDGKYMLTPETFPDDAHSLYSNGTLWYGNNFISMQHYCVESVDGVTQVFVCFDNQNTKKSQFHHILYPIGLLASTPFLLATALIYTCIDANRDLQGKALACQVTCLAVGYFFLSLVQLASHKLNDEVCIAAAFIIQFCFVACFFWLNILSFDTWRNIQNDLRASYGVKRSAVGEKRKFIYYSLYGWYGPCMLSIVSLVMDLFPDIPDTLLKPQFGVQSCWFSSDQAALPYFYGPVGILVGINLVFYVLSARKIYQEQKKIYRSQPKGSATELSSKFRICIRALRKCVCLFCVMGINWIAEVISWAVGGPEIVWIVGDIFNIFQGVIIFYIFVLNQHGVKMEVWRILQDFWFKRIRCKGEDYQETRTNRSQTNIEEEEGLC